MSDARRLRIEALHNGLPFALWWVLVAGGLATVVFTYFFGVKNIKLQVVMTAIVTLVICLNIFLLYSYDDPFSGDVMVHPTAFEADLMMFKTQWNADKDKDSLEKEVAP
jgi:ABC-type branched-subunit amino acid transport system permease subunit